MIAKEKLKELIDELPEGELVRAERFLEYLRDRARSMTGAPGKTIDVQLPREGLAYRILSPRFVDHASAEHFKLEVTILDRPVEDLPDDAL